MSTNQNLTNRTTDAGAGKQGGAKQPKAKALDLSVTQVIGGALAAITAAWLGSQLSAAGTLVGAALVSIVTAVGGALYTASIRRTREKVKTVFYTGQPNEVDEPTVIDIVADSEGHIKGQRSHLVEPEPAPSPRGPRTKLNWKRVAVAALAIFGIAAVSLTAFELVTGHALSGGEGTTFQQVREGGTAEKKEPDTKKKAPSQKPATEATAEASETPSSEPRETASSEEPSESTAPLTPEPQGPSSAPEPTYRDSG